MITLNNGSVFKEGEQEIYLSIYVYEHTGLVVGYQSIAKYHIDIDAVVIQFVNTTNFDGYTWNLLEIVYNRIIKIIRKQKRNSQLLLSAPVYSAIRVISKTQFK